MNNPIFGDKSLLKLVVWFMDGVFSTMCENPAQKKNEKHKVENLTHSSS
jgi:hypothetical protein